MGEKTEAQKKAQQKYMEKFVRVEIRMDAEKREIIQAHAEAHSESVNGFINRAIGESMGTVSVKAPQNAAGMPQDSGDILTPEALKTAQDAAEKAGETVPEFVGRAVETQAKRDKVAFAIRPKEKAPDHSGT